MRNKFLLVVTGISVATTAQANQKIEKPNVLIIYCDQLAAWPLGAYGGKEIGTPNIDRLAKEGVLTTNFYANTPVSTPSRGSFMSGLYPTEHGAFKNDQAIRQDISTFASDLRDAGYITGYAGKWHLDGNPKRPGWDIRGKDMGWSNRTDMYSFGHYKTINDNPNGYPIFSNEIAKDPSNYPTDWFTSKTIEFIDKNKDNPFCYMLSIPDPHGPYSVRAPYDKKYPAKQMIMPATLTENPKTDYFLHNETRIENPKAKGKKEYDEIVKTLPKNKSQYFGMIKLIDDNVGRILDYLDKNKLTDKTIIIFTADHGDMMGEHARMAKAVPFDGAARVPFIVRYPKKIPANKEVSNVLSCIDFYPTILDLTGQPCSAALSGKSAASLLMQNKNTNWNDQVYYRSYSQNYPWVGVVTPKYKLIYGSKDVKGKAWLVDRIKDPNESYNYIEDPQYKEIIKDLSQGILAYCKKHNDPFLSWVEPRVNKLK